MDASQPLPAAILTTLSAVAQSAHSLANFIRDVPFSRPNLDPLTYELLDLRTILERLLDEAAIPPPLRSPVLALMAACRDVLGRIDDVLSDCGDGPMRSSNWAATAKDESRGLKGELQACRRAMRLALETVNLAVAIDFMADTNAVGVGPTDIKHDAWQILARTYRLRGQVSLGGKATRLAAALQRGIEDLIGYAETICGDEDADGTVSIRPDSSSYDTSPRSVSNSRMSMRQMSHAPNRISTTDSNPNSLSSSDSRPPSTVSGTWFSPDDDEPPEPRPEHIASQRRHTNDSTAAWRDSQHSSRRDLSRTASSTSAAIYSLYPPPPTKPLPAIPPKRIASKLSLDGGSNPPSTSTTNSGDSKASATTTSTSDRMSTQSSSHRPTHPTPYPPAQPSATYHTVPTSSHSSPKAVVKRHHPSPPNEAEAGIDVVPWKTLAAGEKDKKDQSVTYIDVSTTSAFLACKQGNNVIRVWDLRSGAVQSTMKVSFYVQSKPRSRDYFVRSHAILSETTNLVAIAADFGHSLQIWNWASHKKLQTIPEAFRYACVRGDIRDANWPALACYRDTSDAIDLFPVARDGKKPFGKARTIELRRSGLPHIPKYPELAYSATGPLLVAAAGPRPPRVGVPPPQYDGVTLMAWELDDEPGPPSHKPYKWVMPDLHKELETSLPLCLATYGSVAVSIWLPATYRAVAGRGAHGGWQLEAVVVTHRYVLVWDFSSNTTRTYPIPDVVACVSPDCRLVAYCDAANGVLAVLDATTGQTLWRGAEKLAGPPAGPQGLHQVLELAFSGDGGLLFAGMANGKVAAYEVREGKGKGGDVLDLLRARGSDGGI